MLISIIFYKRIFQRYGLIDENNFGFRFYVPIFSLEEYRKIIPRYSLDTALGRYIPEKDIIVVRDLNNRKVLYHEIKHAVEFGPFYYLLRKYDLDTVKGIILLYKKIYPPLHVLNYEKIPITTHFFLVSLKDRFIKRVKLLGITSKEILDLGKILLPKPLDRIKVKILKTSLEDFLKNSNEINKRAVKIWRNYHNKLYGKRSYCNPASSKTFIIPNNHSKNVMTQGNTEK